jgi:ABC-type uncharacterized transport system involved in gliding motility auxiliary subunit
MLNIFKRRNFRFGILSVVITAAVILFVALLNFAVSVVFNRFPLNIDLTENKIFEISGTTRDFLEGLDTDIQIYVLNTEDRFITSAPAEYFVQANEVIRKYSQLSGRIKLSYLDLLRNPNFSSQYPDLTLRVNDILITADGESRVLTSSDLFNIRSSNYGAYVASSKAEQAMTSALLAITSRQTTTALVLNGHGEEDISALTDLLELNAWETDSLYLPAESIPGDVSMLIMAAPSRDITENEARKLDAFLDDGDKRIFFYIASNERPPLPTLDAFLAEWGIEIQAGTVFESVEARFLYNNNFVALGDYAEDSYSETMQQRNLLPLLPFSRPLGIVYEAQRYRTTQALIRMSATSGIVPPDVDPDWRPGREDIVGDIPVLALSTFSRNNIEGDIIHNYVLVLGSLMALHQEFLASPNLANSDYFLELTGKLAGREDSVFIIDKTLGFTELGATAGEIGIMGLVFVVLLPLIVLGTGIGVWLRRRHK